MITPSQLQEVQELAGLFFSIPEIAMLTGIDEEELTRAVNVEHSALNNAYWIGKLSAMKDLRVATMEFAKKGSPQAEEQMMKFLQQMNESEG